MTNYRGNFLYGFIACGPYEVLPEWVFDKVFCPAVETDPVTGEAKVAQVGLRRVESALHQGYDKKDVFVANPEHLAKSIGPDTKLRVHCIKVMIKKTSLLQIQNIYQNR